MILSAGIEGGKSFTAPSATGAWTEVIRTANSSNFFIVVLRKIAVQADVNATSFSVGVGGGKYSIGLSRITGHSATNPIAASGGATGSGTAVASPAITTTAANQLVLSFHGVKKSAAFSASGSFGTEIYDVAADPPSHAAYRYVQAGAGSTGTKTATSSQSEQWVGIQVAIRSGATSPEITPGGSLSARTATYGTASSAASFTVSGSLLTGNLTVTPPAGFETSLTEGSGYGSSTTITASGTLASTTVFVRLAATTTPGSYSGNISIAGGGATTQSIAIPNSTVTAKALTVTGLTGNNKVYNRSTAASASGTAALSGIVGSDIVTLTGTPSFAFANVNVGTAKAITTTGYTLSGTNAGNYTLTQPTLTANITAKPLTITGLTGTNKVYNRTTAASASGTPVLSGVETGDTVTRGGTATFTFASANVGTGISITTTGYTLSGTNAGNYTLTQPTLTANITAKPLTITGLTGTNKVYNRTTAASASGTPVLSGVETGDTVTRGGTATFTFASANVGTGISITTTGYTLSGTNAGNYTLTQPTLSANITAKPLTITGLTGNNKVYDRSTAASASGTAALSGVESPDAVSITGTPSFTFASDNVGTAIGITTTGYTLAGAAAGNYSLTQPSLSANITAKDLTITAAAASKASGATDPTLTYSSNGLLDGGSITGSLARASGETAGVYPITQGTLSAGGNYSISFTGANFVITGLRAVADSIQKPSDGSALKIPVASLLANDGSLNASGEIVAEPNLTVTAAQTSLGAALTIRGQFILFLPTTNGVETFTYTVSNGTATSTATVTLTGDASAPSFSLELIKRGTAASSGGSTSVTHDFLGVPNQTYRIQYSTNLSNWTTAPDQSSGSTGSFSVTFTQSGDHAASWNNQMFFRATKP